MAHGRIVRAMSPSTWRFTASGGSTYAQRALANSVAPPSGGTIRAESSEHSADTVLNELSLCQSMLASW